MIIYGPPDLFDAVGDFVSVCKIYLQDPLYCDRNVQYRNPHLLSGEIEEPIMTSSLVADDVSIHVEEISPRPDLFELLRTEDPLPETATPSKLRTSLYR